MNNEIKLYILVDTGGRIYYTSSIVKDLEIFKKKFNNRKLQIVELKGVINEVSSTN